MSSEFKQGFIVGIVVSLLLVGFFTAANANDRFIVLASEPITEGAPQRRFQIKDVMTNKCYNYVPGGVLHEPVLEEINCPI